MAIIRSKWPDINIPENLSLTEFVFKNFDIYGNRPAIVRIVLYFSLICVKWFVLFYVSLLIPFLRSAECVSVWFCRFYSPYFILVLLLFKRRAIGHDQLLLVVLLKNTLKVTRSAKNV